MRLAYPAIFTPYEDGTGGYAVEFPDLPGCVTGGSDMAEAIFMAEDAASGWVLTELEEGRMAPKASTLGEVHIAVSYTHLFVVLKAKISEWLYFVNMERESIRLRI